MNDDILKSMFPDLIARKESGKCPTCGKDPQEVGFRNQISRTEFKLSGMCQECQDDVFGED